MRRRSFLGLVSTLLAAGAAPGVMPQSFHDDRPFAPMDSKIKLGMRLPPRLCEAELKLLNELGLNWCRLDLNPEDANYEMLMRTRDEYRKMNVNIFSITHRGYGAKEIGLGLPGRDEKIEILLRFLDVMKQAEISTFEISHEGWDPETFVWSTGESEIRGGIKSREFDLRAYNQKHSLSRLTHSADDMWEYYKYYMDALLPAAESNGIRIAMHPDDPPLPENGGTAQIFYNIDCYRKAFAMHKSPNFGVLFCVGTWAEGGTGVTGLSIEDAIREFSAMGKLFSVHLRNVTAPLPKFAETYLDEGYVDMQSVMNTLVDVDFDGLVVPDHIPKLSGDKDLAVSLHGEYQSPFLPAGIAYSAACMNILHRNATSRRRK